MGIQLQGGSIKMFAAPEPYPAQATESQHEGVAIILQAVQREMRSNKRITTSKKRGFRSFKVAPARAVETLEIEEWAKDIARLIGVANEALDRLVESNSLTVEPQA